MKALLARIKLLYQSGAFHIVGSNAINKMVTFISSIIVVRILTTTEYGLFTYAWNIYSIILLFNGMGIDSGVLQLGSERSGDSAYAEKLSNYATRFGIRFNMLLTAVILVIGLFFPMEIEGAGMLLCMLCLLPTPKLISAINSIYLRTQKRNKEMSGVSVLTTVVVLIITNTCAWLFREKGLVLGYYIAYIFSVVVTMWHCKLRYLRGRAILTPDERKTLFSISFVSMCNNGLSQLMYLLDVFVLGVVVPDETVLASYKVATTIPSALTLIPIAVMVYLYPYFAQNRNDGKWCMRKYGLVLGVMGAFNAVVSVTLFFFAPFVIRTFFGANYMDAVPIFKVLAINYFFSGTFRILSGNLLVTQRKLKFNLFVAIFSGVSNAVANFFFILWWGPMGAAIATVCVVILTSILNTVYLLHTFKKAS